MTEGRAFGPSRAHFGFPDIFRMIRSKYQRYMRCQEKKK